MPVPGTDLLSFGEVLQSFRKRRHLTQQHLAAALGVGRNTVGRWERGDFLPESKGMVLELARHLCLDDQETRHLLEASLTALSPYWSVPLPRNSFFTGREAILGALHTQLGVNRAVALTQSAALHGLGGVGKTQLALEYAYRYALEYSAVFWIGAETEEQIVSSLVHIAEVSGLLGRDAQDQQRIVAAVQHWLTTHSQWLLIWDNVEDLTVLERFLPPTRQGTILLTTRLQTLNTLAQGFDLVPMDQEEGLLFLLRRAKVLSSTATSEDVRQLAVRKPAQYQAATELVTEMGGLPLALDQAGAYLEATRCGLPAYLELFHTERAALLQQRGEGVREHPASVSTTFTLALAATAQRHLAVGDLLRVCAQLQPEAIPEELFRQGATCLGAALEAACRDPLEWNRVVARACAYSLVSRHPEAQTLSLHRLVQAILVDTITAAEREQWSRCALRALDAAFPEILSDTAYPTWKQCERLLSHALACVYRAEAEKESLVLASLAHKIAQYLRVCGRYAEAEPLSQRSLHIREQVLGPDHPQVATVLTSLASLYKEQGKYVEAEALYQRTLRIWEQRMGPDDLQAATTLMYLAGLYVEQGKYLEAEPLHQRALHIREQALGLDDPQVAHSLIALAILYRRQGNYEQAVALFQRALYIREQALGLEHPSVASPLYNLANLFLESENYEQAEPLFQRALHIWEQALGPDHPNVAYALNGLAIVCTEQGHYEQAEPLFQRALHIWEQALGPEHPHLASPLQELARLFLKQQNYAQAKPLFQQALSIRERHLGPGHPETAQTLHDLAIFYQQQGNLNEARSLAERALHIRAQVLGDTHLKTIDTQTLYAQLLQQQAAARGKTASEQETEAVPDACSEAHQGGKTSLPLHKGADPLAPANDSLQDFLYACCELHPLAWCRIRDLWQTYEHWTASCQGRIPLSRRTFAAQVKARGCRVDRTSSARIWRGIRLVKTNP